MVKGLTIKDELFYVEINGYELSEIRYLKIIDSKKCLTAKFTDYSPFKYFFEVKNDMLVDVEYMSASEFANKFKNKDIEIIKYKKEDDNYWKDYYRPKRDYNWKYEIANGVNKEWVMMKKELIDDFASEIKSNRDSRSSNNDNIETLKALEKGFDDMIDCVTQPMAYSGSFVKPGASGYVNISMERSTAFFDTLLKEFYKLNSKYEKRTDHQVYSVLLDFKCLVESNQNLNQIEMEVTNYILECGLNYDSIIKMLNTNFKRKNKPFDISCVKQMVDYIIPNKLFKQYDEICRENMIQ